MARKGLIENVRMSELKTFFAMCSNRRNWPESLNMHCWFKKFNEIGLTLLLIIISSKADDFYAFSLLRS